MKRIALSVGIAAALAGCASTPAPILRPGEQIVIGSTPSRFDAFQVGKGPQQIEVRAEPRPAPTKLDRALFGSVRQ